MNFADILAKHASSRPDHPAIVDGSRVITYQDLHRYVFTVAINLQTSGIKAGDVVAVTLVDSAEYRIAILALARAGAVMVSIDGELPAPEKVEAISHARAKAIVIGTPEDSIADLPRLHIAKLFQSTLADFEKPSVDSGHPLTIVQSSGTTGTPKSFFWSHRAMEVQAIRHQRCFGWTEQDRYLAVVSMKFFWERELCFILLYLGATIIVNDVAPPDQIVEKVRAERITIMALTPAHLNDFLGLQTNESPIFPSVRTMVVGSAPLTNERRIRVRRQLTPNFYEQLGTNEAGLLVLGTPGDQDARPDAIGRVVTGVEAKVTDANGNVVPSGVVGLVGFRGEGFPSGYVENPEATARSFRDGWFYPGDLAAIDEHGYFHFKGRIDDIINFQGAKFYPIEVEKALLAHPAVAEATVIGWPDPTSGETPVAFVVTLHQVSADELRSFCCQRIASYKSPNRFVFVNRMPKTRTGKILRRSLKEIYGELLAKRSAAPANTTDAVGSSAEI